MEDLPWGKTKGPTAPLLPQEAEVGKTAPETHDQLLPLCSEECLDLRVTGVVCCLHQLREGGPTQSGEGGRKDHWGQSPRYPNCVPSHELSEEHSPGPFTTTTSPLPSGLSGPKPVGCNSLYPHAARLFNEQSTLHSPSDIPL